MLKSVQLGNSGLRVSELCLGTMNFGKPGRGHQGDWTLTEEEATLIFKTAIDKGLFYFDCADVYGLGASEEVVGSILRKMLPRDEICSDQQDSDANGAKPKSSGLIEKACQRGD